MRKGTTAEYHKYLQGIKWNSCKRHAERGSAEREQLERDNRASCRVVIVCYYRLILVSFRSVFVFNT